MLRSGPRARCLAAANWLLPGLVVAGQSPAEPEPRAAGIGAGDGQFWLFYPGVTRNPRNGQYEERIGAATSSDLVTGTIRDPSRSPRGARPSRRSGSGRVGSCT
jgi:hypothetical protein